MKLEKDLGVFDIEIELTKPVLVRIDCELMRIWAWPRPGWNGKHRIYVWRGQNGTVVTAHKAGAPIELVSENEE